MTAKREETGTAYLRVETTIYKRVQQPLSSGRSIETLLAWNVETLRQDFGKDYLARIPKYDGFCTVPDHTNYLREIHGFLNRYEPIPFQPAEGDFPHIRGFLSHIFGEQVEIGYDYLQLLYLRPLQRLPVLLLVSSERSPVLIEAAETRYWVRRIPPLTHDDQQLLARMQTEIPGLLFFLQQRTLSTREESKTARIYTVTRKLLDELLNDVSGL
ncbi:hypothetical protein B5G09_08685 [Alistipes sp. An54]|uniref:hypothetical protein n=1 Tax=Alistipes sp. An54 TaxID=1965645 RepID=UPI000B3969C2|nr:hypothetical protein [Alistipes sp. An54]OUN76687.1 hypothetical protein B5G09_08685 [Alistipes sp. An54]